ncbi:MAG: M23 family metallopeptidase [Bacteroidota bacterium]
MRFLTAICFFLLVIPNYAQKNSWVCGSPMDIPLTLAGSFSELRSNHFHSGIDIRTQGKENLPIYAADDGYVERMKISGTGYGKAIYIAHASGYSTVYAHMNSFIPEISDLLLEEHKKKQSYELDWYPEKNAIRVKRGQLIGYSGNTGSSSGPHLHFEVRHSASELALNPLDFGLVISDSLPPIFTAFSIIEQERGSPSSTPANCLPKIRSVDAKWDNDTLIVQSSAFRLAVAIDEPFGKGSASCGVDQLEMFCDGKKQYEMKMKEVNFGTTKAINAFQPFGLNKANKGQWYGCYRAKNLPLSTVSKQFTGLIKLEDTLVHELLVVAYDWQGNKSELHLKIRQGGSLPESISQSAKSGKFLEAGKEHLLKWSSGELVLAETALYDDAYVTLKEGAKSQSSGERMVYGIVTIGHNNITLFKGAEIKISQSLLPEDQRSKAVIVRQSGDSWNYEGGSNEAGFVSTSISSLGKFALTIDNTKPKIEVAKWGEKSQENQFQIRLKITDDLSGIASIYPSLNDQWLYYETDKKTNGFTCLIPENPAGEYAFKVVVKDKVGNKAVLEKVVVLK